MAALRMLFRTSTVIKEESGTEIQSARYFLVPVKLHIKSLVLSAV